MSDLALYGLDLFGDAVRPSSPLGPLAEKFTVPPFSVLDARSGGWQERKDAWKRIGLRSEIGRKDDMAGASWGAAWMEKHGDGSKRDTNGTSVFDPLLCELAYRWFSPRGGQVVDPFAGGSVRGIVAGALGRRYWGCDLRSEQIEANEAQADEIHTEIRPEWVCGDSMDLLDSAPCADLVFSCPPYGDLEQYSDDPRDLSAMDWHAFKAAYARIILRAVKRLRPDSFACFVVGDFRDSKGFYRNFVGATIDAFEQCGARLYNEAVLLQATGTAAMRAAKQFDASRKLVKLHQNVLVFCNGDPRKATAKCREAA
jgi:hypothetical protein